MKKIVFFLLFYVNIINAQTSHIGHIRILDNDGVPVVCTKISFVSDDGKSKNAKCNGRAGCCIPGNCTGLETIVVEPQNLHYFEKKIEFGCTRPSYTVFSKPVISNMEFVANKHLNNNEKLKSIKYYKNLAYTYKRTGQLEKALETEKKSYEILSGYLLYEDSNNLVQVQNNELVVDEKLRKAIKDYQLKNNLKKINGEFTSEMADSFKGNDKLFLKDKVFTKKK
jgi:hypothetical protein